MSRLTKMWHRLHEDKGMERAWRASIAERDLAIKDAIKEIEIVRGLNKAQGESLADQHQRVVKLEGLLESAYPSTIGGLRRDIERALAGRETGVET